MPATTRHLRHVSSNRWIGIPGKKPGAQNALVTLDGADHDGRLTIHVYDTRRPSERRWTQIILDEGGLIEFAQADKLKAL